jgi:hypothetical protein
MPLGPHGGYVLVRPGQRQSRFLSAVGASDFSAHRARETLNLVQRLFQRLRCPNALTALERAEIF